MSLKLVRVATLLSLFASAAAFGSSAAAWPFSAPAKPAASGQSPGANGAAAEEAAPKPATAEQKAAASRLDPISRAAFWQHQLEISPADANAALQLSTALRALSKYDEAAAVADRMAAAQPNNLDILLEAARTHVAAGQGFYALNPLRQAMKLAPKDWRPVSLMALALDQDKRPDEALASYQEALRLSPENPAILSNLALYYAVRKNIPEAEALLRRAVAQPGATAQERQNLALVLGLQGKSLEAEHWMRQDLPPEAADANLSYLEAAATPFARSPASAPAASSHASGRTWGSLTADGSAVVR